MFTQKLLVNCTINFKEMASNTLNESYNVQCGLYSFKINIMNNKTSDALFFFAFNITYGSIQENVLKNTHQNKH